LARRAIGYRMLQLLMLPPETINNGELRECLDRISKI
jgi:arsenate reductase